MPIRLTQKTAMLATTALLASCLPMAMATSASASAIPSSLSAATAPTGQSHFDAADLQAAFDLVSSIPDSVLVAGDAATALGAELLGISAVTSKCFP